jgi:hypothetical protein
MSSPRVPDDGGDQLKLSCGKSRSVRSFDLGMREYECECGTTHGVVMDVHPANRFLPEFLTEILQEAIETTSDSMPEFGTAHLMGMVLEEFPQQVATRDVSEDGEIGTGIIWVTEFDARRLHEIIVELVVELMEHAMSHADDNAITSEFEQQMLKFDTAQFVDQYREQRDLSATDVGY